MIFLQLTKGKEVYYESQIIGGIRAAWRPI